MDKFIVRANIDHYIELLRVEVVPETRSVLNSLLIEEENKLARTLEQLEFAESRAARMRAHYERMSDLRDGLPDGSAERQTAERLVATFEATLQIMDGACARLRNDVDRAWP